MRPLMDRQWPRLTAFLCCYVAAAHRVERAGYTCDTCGVILNYCALGLQLAVHLVHIGATQSHRLVDFHWFQTLSTRDSECKIRVALFNVNIMRNVFPQQIYDGTYRNSRLLLSHSKDSKPSSVRSTSNNLFIQIIRERPHPRDRINARPMNFTAVYASVILSDLLQYFKINSTLNSY